MKKKYSIPSMTIVMLNNSDIVTSSGDNIGFGEGDGDMGNGARQRRTSIWDDEF